MPMDLYYIRCHVGVSTTHYQMVGAWAFSVADAERQVRAMGFVVARNSA